MTTLHPSHQATVPALPDAPSTRTRVRPDRSDLAPAWAQLAAAIVATSLIWLAADVFMAGFGWAALPLVVLGIAIFGGSVLPDFIAARWEREEGR